MVMMSLDDWIRAEETVLFEIRFANSSSVNGTILPNLFHDDEELYSSTKDARTCKVASLILGRLNLNHRETSIIFSG